MLLFATTVVLKKDVSTDDFLALVIEWNKRVNQYDNNMIENIRWDGSRNAVFEDELHKLEFLEYAAGHIMAVRYTKNSDSAVWYTEYILNEESRKLSIRLQRSYIEDALDVSANFSTPYFIKMLVDKEWLEDDRDLPILYQESIVESETDLNLMAEIILGKIDHSLPVVYISKRFMGTDPTDVKKMAFYLKGAAHVFVEENPKLARSLFDLCGHEGAYNGSILIVYPTGKKVKYPYQAPKHDEDRMMAKVVSAVINDTKLHLPATLTTWDDVNYAVVQNKMKDAVERQAAAEAEKDEVYTLIGEENKELQNYIDEQKEIIDSQARELADLRSRIGKKDAENALLQRGDESDIYSGEVEDFVLEILNDAYNNSVEGTRRHDVLKDLLNRNEYKKRGEKRRERLRVLDTYNGMRGPVKQELLDLGFDITDDGKHIKLIYGGDERYICILAKTPSDHREGKNARSQIARKTM